MLPRSNTSKTIGGFVDDTVEPNFIATSIAKAKAWADEYANRGMPKKDPEQVKMDAITEAIKTYRGLAEEDDEDDGTVHWVDKAGFDVVMILIILANTLVIGLEIDLDRDKNERGTVWILLEVFFVLAFTLEILFKMHSHGKKIAPLKRSKLVVFCYGMRWALLGFMNFLTTIIATLAFVDLAILYPMRLAGVPLVKGVLRLISLMRIIGLLRLARIIRYYSALSELRLLLQGLSTSLQSIFWVVIVAIIYVYVNACMLTVLIGKNMEVYGSYKKLSGGWDHEEFFGTIAKSMYTLMQVMTLDEWSSKIARHVVGQQPIMVLFFCAFILIGTFGLLNVVVGVMVERVLTISEANAQKSQVRGERKRESEYETFKEIFEMSDFNSDLKLQQDEFVGACEDPNVIDKLAQHELGKLDVMKLFEDLHSSSGLRALTLKEFVQGIVRIKGLAVSKDLLEIQAQADNLAQKMDQLVDEIYNSEKMMTALDETSMRIKRRFSHAVHGSRVKIAHAKGGSEPVVQPKRNRPGMQEQVDLGIGNRPSLPHFPNLLN